MIRPASSVDFTEEGNGVWGHRRGGAGGISPSAGPQTCHLHVVRALDSPGSADLLPDAPPSSSDGRLSMRQVALVSNHTLQIQEVDPPEPAGGEVLIQTRFMALCGSDVHMWEGQQPDVRRPIVLGHECTGVVVRSTVGKPEPGTPVAIVPLFSCGQCVHCRAGQPQICPKREVMGFHRPGCLAEFLSMPAGNLLTLQAEQDMALATLFEPLAVAIHAASLAEPSGDDHAVILGAGSIGLLLALYLREELGVGASLVDPNPARVSFARSLGLEAVDQPSRLNLSRLGSRPLAFECVGRAESADAILDFFPAPRVAVLVGTFDPGASVTLSRLKRFETRVVGSMIYTVAELQQALSILSNPRSDRYAQLVVDERFGLDRIEKAFQVARTTTAATKVIVQMSL